MNSACREEPQGGIVDVLRSARNKGVRLWSENGQLHYQAPKGALTQEEIERLRVSRSEIVSFLEGAAGAESSEPTLEPRPRLDRAPLAFTQLALWHLYGLSERHAVRQVASATRLHGRLNIDALRKSVEEIVRRHGALRTRIVVHDGIPTQEVDESGNCELEVVDLSATSDDLREAEVMSLIDQFILEPIDIAVGPLLGVRLLKLRDDEHVLLVAIGHMISDGFSLSIFVRELFAAYIQALNGRAFSLPEIFMQFADYAAWQRNVQKSRMERHGAHWSELMAECQRLRFPEDRRSPSATHSGWRAVPLRIDRDLKAELTEWCRLRRTTLVMSAFTVYVGLVLRWCNASECVIRYQSDARASPNIRNTIGFFASALYVRVRLLDDDTFVDLLNRVTDEYCKAYEHSDSSFMAAQVPRPEFTRNTAFNWIPEGSEINPPGLEESHGAIACSPIRFVHPMLENLELDMEPCVLLFDTDEGIVGDVSFPIDRFSDQIMERFGRNFLEFVRRLLRQSDERVKDIVLL